MRGGTCAISKVEERHVDKAMVRGGRMGELDRVDNDMADQAAVARPCRFWCPVLWDLHRFLVVITMDVVHDDGKGGTVCLF